MHTVAVRFLTDPSATTDEVAPIANAALVVFEDAGDESGLGRTYDLLSNVYWFDARHEERNQMLEQALEHARRAGDVAHEAELMRWQATSVVFGPASVEGGAERLEEMLAAARAASMRSVEGVVLRFLGGIEAMRGRFDQARDLFERGRTILADVGLRSWLAGQTHLTGYAEMLAGDYGAAEREFRHGYDELEQMGETGLRSTSAGLLAEALYEQGRYEEAARYVGIGRKLSSADDRDSQVQWRVVAARLHGQRGELEEGVRLAREAVGFAADPGPVFNGPAWAALGELLLLAGQRQEAASAFREAIRIHERKGNEAAAATTRESAASLGL